jgi:exopolysaccharide production protein ExoZ
MDSDDRSKLISIQYLRALAALMIVFFHAHSGTPLLHTDAKALGWLQGGVDIFFVISGFVMVTSTERCAVTPGAFLLRRLERIVPLYWLFTLVMFTKFPGETAFKLKSLIFIPHLNPDSGVYQPVIGPGWTLNLEMAFYALFAALLVLPAKRRVPVGIGALALVTLAGHVFEWRGVPGFYANPMVLEFAAGMAIARYRICLPLVLAPLGFALMYALMPFYDYRLLAMGIPAVIIVAAAVGGEQRLITLRPLAYMGSASYALYVSHAIVLGFLGRWWDAWHFGAGTFVPVAMIGAVTVGVVTHAFIERPIIAFLGSRRRQRQARATLQTGVRAPINLA